jgi:small subunit ribosomal protein S6
MPLYEHVFLARPDLGAPQVEELAGQYKGVIEQMGGSVAKTEYWGLKSLSYRLRKNRKAHFTLLNIDAPAAALAEIERQQRLSEDVLRYLTIRVDELEAGPSAMMRKADRDERRGERGELVATATVASGVNAGHATMPTRQAARRRTDHGDLTHGRSPAVLPSSQDLSVHRHQRAQDRLQGRAAVAALRLGARQDRAEPNHRRLGQEAARTGESNQARPLPRAIAVRH